MARTNPMDENPLTAQVHDVPDDELLVRGGEDPSRHGPVPHVHAEGAPHPVRSLRPDRIDVRGPRFVLPPSLRLDRGDDRPTLLERELLPDDHGLLGAHLDRLAGRPVHPAHDQGDLDGFRLPGRHAAHRAAGGALHNPLEDDLVLPSNASSEDAVRAFHSAGLALEDESAGGGHRDPQRAGAEIVCPHGTRSFHPHGDRRAPLRYASGFPHSGHRALAANFSSHASWASRKGSFERCWSISSSSSPFASGRNAEKSLTRSAPFRLGILMTSGAAANPNARPPTCASHATPMSAPNVRRLRMNWTTTKPIT